MEPDFVDPSRVTSVSFDTARWGRVRVWFRGTVPYRVWWMSADTQNYLTALFDPEGIAAFLEDPEVRAGLVRQPT